MSLIRNTIMECQVCGECWQGSAPTLGAKRPPCLTFHLPLLSSGFHEHRSRCNPNPCFSGVDCMETYEYPGYRCGPCPPGLEGNGTHCVDIEEVGMVWGDSAAPALTGLCVQGRPCPGMAWGRSHPKSGMLCPRMKPVSLLVLQCAHANPCFPGSKCINTAPGFRCEPCPRGYRGNTVSGVGVDYARASKQVSASPQDSAWSLWDLWCAGQHERCSACGEGQLPEGRNGQSHSQGKHFTQVSISPTLLTGLHRC